MKTHESFTDQEQQLLAPYVTNTDQSVFALTNLPEVIKGALFSRYSRSTLGLRQLLLKDFIQDEESAFHEISGAEAEKHTAAHAGLAIEKAQDFYDRILDGYGDDSIGELGGAHLAVENVSILATKVIQDARIGGSPLEKSTRYVTFAKKVDGEYLFYKEPKLMDSEHRELYLKTNQMLFDTYASFIEPMTAHVERLMPREEGVSEVAYKRSVRAKMFDVIRGLLPAATLTNMGVFGNGRFFESLIAKMHMDPLSELQEVGQSAYDQLHQVIPSFIRRGDKDHRHFQDALAFQQKLEGIVKRFAEKTLTDPTADVSQSVQLVTYDKQAENKLIATLLYPHSQYPLAQLLEVIDNLPAKERAALVLQLTSSRGHRRHKLGRSFEMPFYTFDILGDYGLYRDLHRHRTLTQERQPLSPHFGYEVPPEIEDAGLGERYHEAMKSAAETYEVIVKDFPHEAQYVVPLGYNIRWFVNINLRALMWMAELRSTPQGHEGYRRVAQQMFKEVQRVQPLLAKTIKFVDLNEYPLGRLDSEIRLDAKSS